MTKFPDYIPLEYRSDSLFKDVLTRLKLLIGEDFELFQDGPHLGHPDRGFSLDKRYKILNSPYMRDVHEPYTEQDVEDICNEIIKDNNLKVKNDLAG